MTCKKEETKAMSLTVTEGLTVTILPDSNHEFLMPTKEVAAGYGTSKYVIQKSFLRNSAELLEGKHFIKGVDILSTPHEKGVQIQPHQIFWTKRGIVRLGFYVKSPRAKLFRDWAEELVINRIEQTKQTALFDVPVRQLPRRRNHNRLTTQRLLSIMSDVARIDDRDIRLSITNKLMMEV